VLSRLKRVPIGVRVAVLALAVAVAVAATIAHDDGDSGDGAATRHSAYLGPSGGGSTWVPSRARPRSIVWAIGDGADGGADGRAVANLVASRRVDRFVYLGDVYETGTQAEFDSNYRPLYAHFDAIGAPTIGNHEWGNVATGYVPYWAAARGSPPPLWYSFSVSGWQLLSLNANAPASTSRGQLDWLRRRIAATPRYGTCRIAITHQPRFSAGLHGDLPSLQPMFDELRGHAAIWLAGHDHDMQRLRPVDGITPYVEGAGGNELYPVNASDPRLAFEDDTHHGALRIALRPGGADLTFVAEDGTVLDTSSVACHQA
jgi:hypothetical protein